MDTTKLQTEASVKDAGAKKKGGKKPPVKMPKGTPKSKGEPKAKRRAKKVEYAPYEQKKLLAIRDALSLREALKQVDDAGLKAHAKAVKADCARAWSLNHHGLQRMNAINIIVHAQMNL